MQAIGTIGHQVFGRLDTLGQYLAPLGLRLLLAYEFGEAGLEKLRGENWFEHIRDDFPFPFHLLPHDLSWFMATWSELLGAAMLVVGLGTRFASASLIVLDLVAWYSVHAGNGYNVCDNGFKLPLIFLILLIPLLLNGAGRFSIDHLIRRRFG
ncbi:MAG: DoxX family protein [Chromatiales bacterium]|nr:DoxX family protein [Chromatiales bacterium]